MNNKDYEKEYEMFEKGYTCALDSVVSYIELYHLEDPSILRILRYINFSTTDDSKSHLKKDVIESMKAFDNLEDRP